MAVYKRTYRGYEGPFTPEWSRFLVVTRQASANLFRSRFMIGFGAVCMLPFLVTAILIYLNHNASLLSTFHIKGSFLNIDSRFFKGYLNVQISLAFLFTAFAGPGLISPDLTNNALILYLCRPFTRTEYVVGKLLVLVRLLSFITWIPGLVLFGIEASLSGRDWLVDNAYIAGAIFAGSWILIILLSLLALALSAWVKWKPVAGALVLGVMFLGAGFGSAINSVMRTEMGDLFNIPRLLITVWNWLFRLPLSDFPVSTAWMALSAICAACLYLLGRKLKAFEVVR